MVTVDLFFVFTPIQTPFHSFKAEKSTHLSTKTMCAFFNEIRLRRGKFGFAK